MRSIGCCGCAGPPQRQPMIACARGQERSARLSKASCVSRAVCAAASCSGLRALRARGPRNPRPRSAGSAAVARTAGCWLLQLVPAATLRRTRASAIGCRRRRSKVAPIRILHAGGQDPPVRAPAGRQAGAGQGEFPSLEFRLEAMERAPPLPSAASSVLLGRHASAAMTAGCGGSCVCVANCSSKDPRFQKLVASSEAK